MGCGCDQKTCSLDSREDKITSLNDLYVLEDKLRESYDPEKPLEELIFPEGEELYKIFVKKFEFVHEQVSEAEKRIKSLERELKDYGIEEIPPFRDWRKYGKLSSLFIRHNVLIGYKRKLDVDGDRLLGSALAVTNAFREIADGSSDEKFSRFARSYEEEFRELAMEYDAKKGGKISGWANVMRLCWQKNDFTDLDQLIENTEKILSKRLILVNNKPKKVKICHVNELDIIQAALIRAEGCRLLAKQTKDEKLRSFARKYEEKFRKIPKFAEELRKKEAKHRQEEVNRAYI